jgi:HAMP domain-containing protein
MDQNTARLFATAVFTLGAADDAQALAAARWIAEKVEAEGINRNAFAAALMTVLVNMTKPRTPAGFADLGPRGRRKRLAELSRRKGITAEHKARLMGFRERLDADGRAHVTEDEIGWIDALWTAPTPTPPSKAQSGRAAGSQAPMAAG